MESPKIINPGRPVWISYIGNSSENPEWEHIADCVDTLVQLFKENGVEYCVNDIPEEGDTISEFEKKIGMYSQEMVLVFSDRYFRSLHCMYQLVQIKKAIQKYPNKRLFCIKSGSFNLSDINYILDLEHFWGDQKQEYEEVSYHKTRTLKETEHAAHSNGFYMDDVRSLYSFFSTLNYANASSQDWNHLVKEIITCYTAPSKFVQTTQKQIKLRNTTIKFMVLGLVALILTLFITLLGYGVIAAFFDHETENPHYSKGIDGLQLTNVTIGFYSTALYLTLRNTHDKDTVIFASRSFYLEANGQKYKLSNVGEIPLYPEYKILAPDDTLSFSIEFNVIPKDVKTFDFIMKPGTGIFGITTEKDSNE